MGFEYQKTPLENRGHWTYTDERIDQIYKTKATLEIDVGLELDELKKIKADLQKQYDEVSKKIKDMDDFFADEAEGYNELVDEQWEVYNKLSAVEDLIDHLEDLKNIL